MIQDIVIRAEFLIEDLKARLFVDNDFHPMIAKAWKEDIRYLIHNGIESENEQIYDFKNKEYIERTYDITGEIIGGHSGGDVGIMSDVCNWLNGDKTSISMTGIDDSVNGHLTVYAAERSRKGGNIERVK